MNIFSDSIILMVYLLFHYILFLIAKTDNSSVRSNALFVLGDMCVRYTNLVDRHIGVLAGCLQVRAVCCTVQHFTVYVCVHGV